MTHLSNCKIGARNGGRTSVKLSVMSFLEVLVSVQVSHGVLKEPLFGDEFLGKA